MERMLEGRVALVTGSGRGIGHAIACRLAELGAAVAVHDRTGQGPAEFGEHKDIEDAAGKVRAYGGKVARVMGDISDPDAVRAMVEQAERKLGPIDILVNCAGGDIAAQGGKPNPNTALGIKLEDVRALLDRNFVGTLLMCQAVCPGMVERKRGAVVNIASVAAHFGTSPEVVYSSIKAGIVHFTRCLAKELRPHNVRVNCVSPGATKTGRFVNTRPTDPAKMVEEGLVRYAAPEEIAEAVAFFASDMARFVNGQVLRVDGGEGLFAG
jgi:3-oxoacyl-[acyl-carrier protein] reductase